MYFPVLYGSTSLVVHLSTVFDGFHGLCKAEVVVVIDIFRFTGV